MRNKPPLVGIFIPTYNAEKTIGETIASLLKQTYSHIEIHVVDNASTDSSLNIVEAFSDPRIQIHRHDIHVSGNESYSRCIRLARGEYTAIFHADDIYAPEIISKQVDWLVSHSKASAVFTEASLVDEFSKTIGAINTPAYFRKTNQIIEFKDLFKAILRYSNFLVCPSVMIKTSSLKGHINGMRGDIFKSAADLDLWLRLSQCGGIGIIAQELMKYRISQNQYSALVRLQTNRSDFFCVTDYYCELPEVKGVLSKNDLDNLAVLEMRDKAMRAVNFLLIGMAPDAGALLQDPIDFSFFRIAARSKRGICTLILFFYIKILLYLKLDHVLKITLIWAKRVMHK